MPALASTNEGKAPRAQKAVQALFIPRSGVLRGVEGAAASSCARQGRGRGRGAPTRAARNLGAALRRG